MLSDHGTRVIKFMMHISPKYQLKRFQQRLDNPDKHWKFSSSDMSERQLWGSYMSAFEDMLQNTSKENAPWYVIPAEKKWFRYLLVSQVILDVLTEMDPQYPKPQFDTNVFTPGSLM